MSGEFSDLIIAAGGREFKVHTVVVCRFARFKTLVGASQDGRLELPESAEVVDAVLRCMYGFEYAINNQHDPDTAAADFQKLVDTCFAADKYDVRTLAEHLATRLHGTIQQLPGAVPRLTLASSLCGDDLRGRLQKAAVDGAIDALRHAPVTPPPEPTAKATAAPERTVELLDAGDDLEVAALPEKRKVKSTAKATAAPERVVEPSDAGDAIETAALPEKCKIKATTKATAKATAAPERMVEPSDAGDAIETAALPEKCKIKATTKATAKATAAPERMVEPSDAGDDIEVTALPEKRKTRPTAKATAAPNKRAKIEPATPLATTAASEEIHDKHCVCQVRGDNQYLIVCDQCGKWFHPGCIGKGQYAASTYSCNRVRSQRKDADYFVDKEFKCAVCQPVE
ncbi:hypothetical protein LTR36_009605 [Oleoguttula mirabilis]|uniref:BTB domain-containing protein n=1 Tax=Oleoguttula mirabilis TaxID=1507867 RepID=A0AAV9J687_9PEZI|nr:hypothetical protein LTR36_009605 [Oleoguttula mirabilis]